MITEEEFPEDKPPENPPEELEMEEPSNKENRPFSNTEKVVIAASAGRLFSASSVREAGVVLSMISS